MARSLSMAALTVGLLSASAIAQTAPEGWTRVEAGIADLSPLASPMRQMQADMRMPTGFDAVYRLDRRDPAGVPTHPLFARIHGGVTAVFARSEYTVDQIGPVAEVPAGTTFYIGGLPPDLVASDRRDVQDGPNVAPRGRLETRLSRAVPTPQRSGDSPTRPVGTERRILGTFAGESARTARVEALIRRAAAAEKARESAVSPRN